LNWISNVVRPRIRSFLSTKREVPDNLWVQCPESGQMVFHKDLEANAFVIPGSDYHMRMGAQDRLAYTFDDGAYEAVPLPTVPVDPLKFRDGRKYTDRLKDAKSKVALEDAVLIGEGTIEGSRAVVAVQDFRFMGGSLGMAAGEAVITGMERAVASNVPYILFAASGGARMQEGILSLMQMPRTTIAVQRLRDARLPYIVVLTDPTTGGVTASYAMLGDVHIAEPGALICFAGPRVIEQTIREQLPDGFQRAEYLLEHGMIDMVVHRHKMRETLGRLCRVLGPNEPMPVDAVAEPADARAATAVAASDAPVTADADSAVADDLAASAPEVATDVEAASLPTTDAEPTSAAVAPSDNAATSKSEPAKAETSMLGDLSILSSFGFSSTKAPAAKAPDSDEADVTPAGGDAKTNDPAEPKTNAVEKSTDAKLPKADGKPGGE
jgi:acetyl-CoA carboxylase carboxyl transferase subunit beta